MFFALESNREESHEVVKQAGFWRALDENFILMLVTASPKLSSVADRTNDYEENIIHW